MNRSRIIPGSSYLHSTSVGSCPVRDPLVRFSNPETCRPSFAHKHVALTTEGFVNKSSVLPVCQVNYMQTYFLNTVLLPACLMALVAMTWATNSDKGGRKTNTLSSNEEYNEVSRSPCFTSVSPRELLSDGMRMLWMSGQDREAIGLLLRFFPQLCVDFFLCRSSCLVQRD